jgi:hypothetical protein
MTIRKAIQTADELSPNAYGTELKIQWLNHLEGRLALEVFLMAPAEAEETYHYEDTPEDLAKTLLVGPPYDDLYTWWLRTQIDLAHAEYDKAQNDLAMFNAAWSGFVCWFCQRYDPAQGYPREENA